VRVERLHQNGEGITDCARGDSTISLRPGGGVIGKLTLIELGRDSWAESIVGTARGWALKDGTWGSGSVTLVDDDRAQRLLRLVRGHHLRRVAALVLPLTTRRLRREGGVVRDGSGELSEAVRPIEVVNFWRAIAIVLAPPELIRVPPTFQIPAA
jgi:hypothetical protein